MLDAAAEAEAAAADEVEVDPEAVGAEVTRVPGGAPTGAAGGLELPGAAA
jgi:hypothetical protein